MFLYFDKQGTLKTAIPHGNPVRQGDDLQIVVCLDSDFFVDPVTKDNWSLQLFLTLPNGENSLGTGTSPTKIPTSTTIFKKTVDSEITYDLVDGKSYWMYEFDIPASQSTVYDGNLIANIKFLKQSLQSEGTVRIVFTDSSCVGPNGTATRTFESPADQAIIAGDTLTINNDKAQTYVATKETSTVNTYKAIFLVGSAFDTAAQSGVIQAVLNRLSTATVKFTGRASIYVETTLGGATTEIDESALHYENLLKQISYLSTILQNGTSIYPYKDNISFVDNIATVNASDILVPTGKKLLLGDIVLDEKGQLGRVTAIDSATEQVQLTFYTAFTSCLLYLYEKKEQAPDSLITALEEIVAISDLSNLSGLRTPMVGDIVIVKYLVANKYSQSTAFGYVTAITDSTCTIKLISLLDGKDGPVTYYLSSTNITLDGQTSPTRAPNSLNHNATILNPTNPYKKGDYIIVAFSETNYYLQKTIFYAIATDPGVTVSLLPISFLDGPQGVRGNGIRIGSGTPTVETLTDLLGDLYLDTTSYDLYKLIDSNGTSIWSKIGNIKGDKGATGETGNGIQKIEKTSTNGLVDTYTITFTNSTTTTFTVTNGKDGVDGADGKGLDDIQNIVATENNPTTTVTANGISVSDVLKIVTSDDSYSVPLSYKISLGAGSCIVLEKEANSSVVKISIDTTKTTDTPTTENRLTTERYVKNVVSNIKTSFVVKASENVVFQSTAKTITLTAPFVDNQGETVQLSELALGENIYVEETRYSDRWVSNIIKTDDTVTSVVLSELKQDKAPVTDVQINDSTIVDNGVAKIPKATSASLGVVKAGNGLETTSDGAISTKTATDEEIVAKTNANDVIVPSKIDKAVKEGLGNSSLTWEESYKQKARTVIGAQEKLEAGNGITITGNVISAIGDVSFEEEDTSSLPVVYEIVKNIVNGYANGVSSVLSTETTATITIVADSGYDIPTTVTVSGATSNYNALTGVVTLTNITGDIMVRADCPEASGPKTIRIYGKADSGYGYYKINDGDEQQIPSANYFRKNETITLEQAQQKSKVLTNVTKLEVTSTSADVSDVSIFDSNYKFLKYININNKGTYIDVSQYLKEGSFVEVYTAD